jgi:hypothetical protein
MAVVVVGQCLVACCVILTGHVGAKWHVGFPMWNRVRPNLLPNAMGYLLTRQMTWGLRASWFPVGQRSPEIAHRAHDFAAAQPHYPLLHVVFQ